MLEGIVECSWVFVVVFGGDGWVDGVICLKFGGCLIED